MVSDLAKDLCSAVSYTHIVRRQVNELKKDIYSGIYVDILDKIHASMPIEDGLEAATNEAFDEPEISQDTKVYTLLEQYVDLDLDGYDKSIGDISYALPYVITVDKDTSRVLSIRRNWELDDPYKKKIVNFFEYTMVPRNWVLWSWFISSSW